MLAGGEIKNDFNAFLTVKRFMSETLSVSDENENAEFFYFNKGFFSYYITASP